MFELMFENVPYHKLHICSKRFSRLNRSLVGPITLRATVTEGQGHTRLNKKKKILNRSLVGPITLRTTVTEGKDHTRLIKKDNE